MSVPDESAITLTGARSGTALRHRFRLRTWILTAVIFLVPLCAYWPTTFHEYGLRDDYSNLREALEEPSVVVRFCASHGRPIYGWLLQASYGQAGTVQNLQWMRLASALLLGAISLVMFRGMRSVGWSFNAALCFVVLLSLSPPAQVIAGWAVGWPYAATALLAIGGFFAADHAFSVVSRQNLNLRRAAGQALAALGIMVVAALIYQPSALFYVVPLAAALISQRERNLKQTLRWLGAHLSLVVASLGLAYAVITTLYMTGMFVRSDRIAFEHHWGDKLAWFLQEVVPNALSLFVLNDDNHRDRLLYFACASLAGIVLIGGAVMEWRRHGRTRGIIWSAGLVGLPVFAFGVSMVASEHYATYRTIFAMTAVLLCFLVASIRSLTRAWRPSSRRLTATLCIAAGFFLAQHHTYALIAVPQGNEWQLIMAGAKHIRLDGDSKPRVLALASSPADISTATIYHDEFGSLSSNSEWVPREMFKRAMHDLHPNTANLDDRYEFVGRYRMPPGYRLQDVPPDEHYDVIIDMHRLRRFYHED